MIIYILTCYFYFHLCVSNRRTDSPTPVTSGDWEGGRLGRKRPEGTNRKQENNKEHQRKLDRNENETGKTANSCDTDKQVTELCTERKKNDTNSENNDTGERFDKTQTCETNNNNSNNDRKTSKRLVVEGEKNEIKNRNETSDNDKGKTGQNDT